MITSHVDPVCVDISMPPMTDLVEVFGEPNILNAEEGDKVFNEWGIRFEDGDDDIYTTIYDWKELDAYRFSYWQLSLAYGGGSSWCYLFTGLRKMRKATIEVLKGRRC